MKAKPRSARRKTGRRTVLRRASAHAVRRLAGEAARGNRLEDEAAALLEGAVLLMGGFALFPFTCARSRSRRCSWWLRGVKPKPRGAPLKPSPLECAAYRDAGYFVASMFSEKCPTGRQVSNPA